MNFYEEMAGVANDLLKEFNQVTAKIVRVSTGGGPKFNPGAGATLKFTFDGATISGVSRKYIDGKDIITSDMQAVLSVAQKDENGTVVSPSVRPLVSDKLELNGKLYNIIADKTVPADGTPVAYILVFRK